MSGPRHLWAGDWERESEAANRQPEAGPPEPPAPEATPPSRRRLSPLLVAAALVLIVGLAFGLSALADNGGHHTATTPTAASVPQSTNPFPQPNNPGGGVQTVPQLTTPQSTAPPQTSPQQVPSQSNATPSQGASSGPIVYWDGMQLQTFSPGVVMIDTVQLGSLADQAGLEPGDQLTAVNGHQLTSATDIATAIKGLSAGKRITVQVVYGSSAPQTALLTLGAPPSRHP